MKRKSILVLATVASFLSLGGVEARGDFAICTEGQTQTGSVIDGNFVVWRDYRNDHISEMDIYGYDLSTASEFPICTNSAVQQDVSIGGSIVVWMDERNANDDQNYDIYGYNLDTQTEFPICQDMAYQSNPAIDANTVVWMDQRDGSSDRNIYGYDLSTSTEFPICTASGNQSGPAISGNIVVWQDYRNGDADIYGYNLDTQTVFPICTETETQNRPSISGNIVVWIDYRNGNSDIYGYDLDTQTEFPICTDDGYQGSPAISGDIVVWEDHRYPGNPPHKMIYGYDLSEQNEFIITEGATGYSYPSISNGIVVWTDLRDDNYDIYGHDVNGNAECVSATEVFEGVPFVGTTIGATGMDQSSCGYNDTQDVWHWFEATTTTEYTISLCGSDFDTTLSVFDKCGGTEIACNDDYCGLQSELTFKATSGNKYIIRVAGYDTQMGGYTLTLTGATCTEPLVGDIDNNCKVDFRDFALMVDNWLKCNLDPPEACWE